MRRLDVRIERHEHAKEGSYSMLVAPKLTTRLARNVTLLESNFESCSVLTEDLCASRTVTRTSCSCKLELIRYPHLAANSMAANRCCSRAGTQQFVCRRRTGECDRSVEICSVSLQ